MPKADNITRGPARWERAALNAIHHPRSKAAKLYFSRYALAREISDNAVTESAYVFLAPTWGNPSMGMPARQRRYVTCSTFCTIMQITLDFSTTDKRDLVDVFLGSHRLSAFGYRVEKINTASLSRPLRCQVCGNRA